MLKESLTNLKTKAAKLVFQNFNPFFSMRLMLLSLFLLLSPDLFARTRGDDRMTFTEIVKVAKDKDALFRNAKLWIATNGKYQSVLLFDDKITGKIVIKGQKDVQVGFVENYRFVMSVDIQDNKYRLFITDVEQGLGSISQSYGPLVKTVNFDELNAKKEKIKENISRLLKVPGKKKKNGMIKISLLENQIAAINARIKMEKDGRAALLSEIMYLQASFKETMNIDYNF